RLLRDEAVVEGPAQSEVDRDAPVAGAILDERREVAHPLLLRQRRGPAPDFRWHTTGHHGRITRRAVGGARISQPRVVEDIEALLAPAVPVLEPGLQLMVRSEPAVDVAGQAKVLLLAVRIAEVLAGRLGTIDVDASRNVERRRMLCRCRQRIEL